MRTQLAAALLSLATLSAGNLAAQSTQSQAAQSPSAPSPSAAPPAAPARPQPGDPHQTAASLADQVPPAAPEDVKSPEAIVAACYSVISGPAGERNWERFRSLFIPAARLSSSSVLPSGAQSILLLTVDDYVRLAGAGFSKMGFYENSIHNEVRTFGDVGQIFSSYESRRAPAEQPFQRGINSFQMIYDGHRWWIISIAWDDERKDNPLPPEFSHK
jgi:hypothetical protein